MCDQTTKTSKIVSVDSKQLLKVVPTAVFTVDINKRITSWNEAAHRLTGYCAEEIIGLPCTTFAVTPCNTHCPLFDLGQQKPIAGRECTIRCKDNTQRFVCKNIDLITDEEGYYIGGVESFVDITEQRKREYRIRSLVEHTRDATFCYEYTPPIPTDLPVDAQVRRLYEGVLADCNDIAAQHFGLTKANNALGQKLTDLFHAMPPQLDRFFEDFVNNQYRTIDAEAYETLPNGDNRYFLNNGAGVVQNGQLTHVWGTFQDITDRRQAEIFLTVQRDLAQALADTNEFKHILSLCLESAITVAGLDSGGVYLLNESSGDWELAIYQGLSPKFAEATQTFPGNSNQAQLVSKGQAIFMQYDKLGIPICDVRAQEGIKAVAILPIRTNTEVIACLNIASHQHETVSEGARQALLTISAQMGSSIARAKAERELRTHRERLEELVEARTHDLNERNKELGLLYELSNMGANPTLSLDNILRSVANRIPPTWQYPKHTCARVSMQGDEYTSENFRVSAWKQSADIEADGKKLGLIEVYYNKEFPPLDDGPFLKEERQLINSIANQLGIIIMNKQLQLQLAQSDRLSSMGILAAGVAHEINNPLTYVLFNLQWICEKVPTVIDAMEKQTPLAFHNPSSSGPDRAEISQTLTTLQTRSEDTWKGAKRIRKIMGDLSTFSRVEEDRPKPVNLTDVIDVAIRMTQNQIKYRARLTKQLSHTPPVHVCDGRLSQVFINLLINAVHAINEGDVDNNEIKITTWSADEHVFASVRDTGVGITPENAKRLFEPFFTTKDIGEGSGLGLAISNSIIGQYGGTIQVESKPGVGSCFTIQLPKLEEQATQIAPAPTEASLTQIRGRILIIDDEDLIRVTMSKMLTNHETVQAASGEEAKRILAQDQQFDLILCDLMMPNVSGIDIHEWLTRKNPSLADRLVFVTGGAFTPKTREYLNKVGNETIEKPFSFASFRKIVTDLLERPKDGVQATNES